ncbi:Phospholipase A2-beta [Hibiscus syriacus]|uniref:phospholipase A2 n=1 Tax=Hibiscus syriacus TaxID=106335 RepID=A0A6A2YU53_HIBSY|nr:Phospholipase A2-beta [Hibiscus syriacus]
MIPLVKCNRTCVAENCDSVGIRYGKYCWVGWSGCSGEKPCDYLDACCKIHDECFEKKGMININCHEKFKSCIKKVQKSGKVGFSWNCPIQMAVPTMMQGMDMVILFSRLGSARYDEQTDRHEQKNQEGEAENVYSNTARSGDKYSHSSFKSTAASFNEEASVNNEIADACSQINMSDGRQMEHFAVPSMNRNSGKNRMQFVNELHDIKNPQNLDHHEIRVREQSSYSPSHCQSNTFTDDHNVVSNLNWQKSENDKRESGERRMQFENELSDTKNSYDDHDVISNLNHQKSGNGSGEDLFILNDEGSHPRSTKETTDSFDNAPAVFDDYGSDNYEDNFSLEEEHKVHEYNMNFPSSGPKDHLLIQLQLQILGSLSRRSVHLKSLFQNYIFSQRIGLQLLSLKVQLALQFFLM